MNYEVRAKGALYGLAIGDAVGWPAFYHRTYTLPFWTRRLRREIDAAQEDQRVLRFPMPFSLNRPTEDLQFAPTDDTEWASFTMEALLETEGELTEDVILSRWLALLDQEEVRGSISVQGALHNLRRGVRPPVTGSDNAHYFDDSACLRAIPIGVVWQGNREKILQQVELDAQVTNSRDGLWAAQALAVAVGALCGGSGLKQAVELARAVLPGNSWAARTAAEAWEMAIESAGSAFALIPKLDRLINKEYSYGGAAPEVLALAFAITALVDCDLERGIMYALAFPKLADSLPAVVGALCGAGSAHDHPAFAGWLPVLAKLRGICLPHLAGRDYLQLVQDLAALGSRLGQGERR